MLKILNPNKWMNRLILTCFSVGIGLMGCNENNGDDPIFAQNDLKGVYVVGDDGEDAKLWIDGTVQTLTGGRYANSVYVSGEDVYVAQANNLPSNTQTAYLFGLQYQDGKLEGLVNIVQRFANPKKQQTSRNDVYEITFVKSKKEDRHIEFSEEMMNAIENKPDVISLEKATFKKDKWGNKLSDNEIRNKLASVNFQLSESYQRAKTKKTTGKLLLAAGLLTTAASIPVMITGNDYRYSDGDYEYYDNNGILHHEKIYYSDTNTTLVTAGYAMFGIGVLTTIVSFPVKSSGSKKSLKIINEYNNQISQQMKDKPTSELRFGATSSGGIGFTLTF